MQQQLLQQLESARQRLSLSPVQLRQLAFEVIQGVSWPVRDLSDLDVPQLEKLVTIVEELERNEVGRRMRQEELVTQ
jgi:hypothetical protein